MRAEIQTLLAMASERLHDEARLRGRGLLRSHWALAACLLAVERSEVHVEHGCSGAVQYAVRFLNIDGHLAAELLRAAKVLEMMPLLSTAFEMGEVAWSKIREITRVAQAEDDAAWVAFARRHTIDEIRQRTVLSPRRWNEHNVLAARAAAPAQMMLPAAAGMATLATSSAHAQEPSIEPASANSQPMFDGEQPLPIAAGDVAPASQPRPAMPRVEPRIGLEFRLTPEDYQIYQQVERSLRAGERRPMTKEAVFVELCRRAQGGGERRRPRIRTRVVVHYDRLREKGWIETSRGIAPVSESRMESALAEAEAVLVAPAVEEETDEADWAAGTADAEDIASHKPELAALDSGAVEMKHRGSEKPSQESPSRSARTSHGKKTHRRPAIPMAVLDALFARSGGCCEMPGCRRSGYLHVHHRRPWSKGGRHDLDNLLLACSTCHRMHHRREAEPASLRPSDRLDLSPASGPRARMRGAIHQPGKG